VRRFDASTGTYVVDFVSSGSGGLAGSYGIAFGPDGNLYVVLVGKLSFEHGAYDAAVCEAYEQ